MQRILIVEDDESVAQGLTDVFAGLGWEAYEARNSREALSLLAQRPIGLVVLDVSLGAEDGYALCREIRRTSGVPVLFLTARDSERELLEGFRAGGDDYLTKPFRVRELEARAQALLRRGGTGFPVRTGELTVEPEKRLLRKNGVPIVLSAVEWSLLAALIARAPGVVTREELLFEVWDREADFVEGNTLSVNMSRLRAKLGDQAGGPYIETVRGVGYRWAARVER